MDAAACVCMQSENASPVAQVLHCGADWALTLGCHSSWPLFDLLPCCGGVSPAIWASVSQSILDLLPVYVLMLVFSAGMAWV